MEKDLVTNTATKVGQLSWSVKCKEGLPIFDTI